MVPKAHNYVVKSVRLLQTKDSSRSYRCSVLLSVVHHVDLQFQLEPLTVWESW